MDARPHLSTLLSQVLVAYTIEADNEFESLMPHRTALSKAAGEAPHGPWLVSLAMDTNFLSLVPSNGIAAKELSARAGLRNLETAGMVRWGYATVDGADKVVRLTAAGRRAAETWAPIETRVEARWRDRFGADTTASLRDALAASVSDIEQIGPNYLPAVHYGLWTARELRSDRDPGELRGSLSALLARALTVIAVAFERTSDVSIALACNALRVLSPDGIGVRDVARTAGIATEITDVSIGFMEKRGLATVRKEGPLKVARPTDAALVLQVATESRLTELDRRFEPARAALESILANTAALAEGIEPHPLGWRAQPRYLAQTERILADPRSSLPRFPIVTHRGGYPDGS